jgi:hypothetical protein
MHIILLNFYFIKKKIKETIKLKLNSCLTKEFKKKLYEYLCLKILRLKLLYNIYIYLFLKMYCFELIM